MFTAEWTAGIQIHICPYKIQTVLIQLRNKT